MFSCNYSFLTCNSSFFLRDKFICGLLLAITQHFLLDLSASFLEAKENFYLIWTNLLLMY